MHKHRFHLEGDISASPMCLIRSLDPTAKIHIISRALLCLEVPSASHFPLLI